DVTNHAWGTLSLQFSDCAHAVLRYQGPDGWGAGERALQRLTSLDQLDCAGDTRSVLENGALAPTALHGHSAAWYAPARAGEGWIIEQLPGGLVALYWFTFGVDGEQAWMVALGTLEGDRAELLAQVTGGTRFGA